MAKQFWHRPDGKLLVDANGAPYFCEECPCATDPSINECILERQKVVKHATYSGFIDLTASYTLAELCAFANTFLIFHTPAFSVYDTYWSMDTMWGDGSTVIPDSVNYSPWPYFSTTAPTAGGYVTNEDELRAKIGEFDTIIAKHYGFSSGFTYECKYGYGTAKTAAEAKSACIANFSDANLPYYSRGETSTYCYFFGYAPADYTYRAKGTRYIVDNPDAYTLIPRTIDIFLFGFVPNTGWEINDHGQTIYNDAYRSAADGLIPPGVSDYLITGSWTGYPGPPPTWNEPLWDDLGLTVGWQQSEYLPVIVRRRYSFACS
jgi:hypothetical protein